MKQKKRYILANKFLFDGCLICDGMKKAHRQGRSLTEEELRKLFKKADKKEDVISF